MLRNLVMMGIGAIVGSFISIIILGLMIAAREGDMKGKKDERTVTIDEPRPRCQNDVTTCGDVCCKLCLVASSCTRACRLSPGTCGKLAKVR